jgi:hypothetical protein
LLRAAVGRGMIGDRSLDLPRSGIEMRTIVRKLVRRRGMVAGETVGHMMWTIEIENETAASVAESHACADMQR